ncbi:MAG: GAF domain-containing sensor histidine kinase [Chloroflexi bacterium]|nr:GAF domain-containing sensor histidine kinase [Chloroflexota bacterium]
MNLNRLLLIAIVVPAIFVIAILGASYFPHQARLLSHEDEHLILSMAMIVGIIPFAFFMLHIFRRIERHIIQQNRELNALLKVGRAVEESVDLSRVLPVALEATLEATTAEAAEVWVVEPKEEALFLRLHIGAAREAFEQVGRFKLGEGYPGIVAETGRPILAHDLPNDCRFLREDVKAAGFKTLHAMPLRRSGGTVGVLIVASRNPQALTSEGELRLLELVAEHIAIAVENAQLHEEVQTLAILGERERLAREMHDGLAQVLGYVNTKAQAVKELLRARQLDTAVQQMEQLESAAQETYDDVREGILALSTNGRKRLLLESLRDYVQRFSDLSGLSTEMVMEGTPWVFDTGAEVQLLRIVQEALTNARKHARAGKVQVLFSFGDDTCRLIVQDDGRGFDPEHIARGPRPHLGLQSMRERAAAIGARFTLDTAQGKGTRIILDLTRAKT